MPKRPDDPFPDESHGAPDYVPIIIGSLNEKLFVRIPPRLVPIIDEIAKRQHTTRAVIVAQALSDYCHRGL